MDPDERSTGLVRFNIGGEPVTMKLDLPTQPMKPHRLLPVFQQMTNYFVNLSVQAVEAQGSAVSCKAKCGACCRQPVPISELEIYQIAELVEAMPEPRQTEVRKRFADAREHFAAIGWFDRVAQCDAGGKKKPVAAVANELKALVADYFNEAIACPFLVDESCSIHAARPLVCREYLVTSPPENCSRENGGDIDRINLFLSPSKTVQHMGVSGKMQDVGFVPLIRALELAERFPESFESRRPELWVDEFFERLSPKQEAGKASPRRPGKHAARRKKPRNR